MWYSRKVHSFDFYTNIIFIIQIIEGPFSCNIDIGHSFSNRCLPSKKLQSFCWDWKRGIRFLNKHEMGFSACLSVYVSPEGTNFRPEKNHISWTCHFDIKPDNPIKKSIVQQHNTLQGGVVSHLLLLLVPINLKI